MLLGKVSGKLSHFAQDITKLMETRFSISQKFSQQKFSDKTITYGHVKIIINLCQSRISFGLVICRLGGFHKLRNMDKRGGVIL